MRFILIFSLRFVGETLSACYKYLNINLANDYGYVKKDTYLGIILLREGIFLILKHT